MKRALVLGVTVWLLIGVSPIFAATYWIAPKGSDKNDGLSTGAPWKTFAHAVSLLAAGDTLLLMDGTYSIANGNGMLNIGDTNAANGSSSQPITVKAQHERQAFIQGDGTLSPICIYSRDYWILEGIHAESADKPHPLDNADAFRAWGSNHCVARRLLLRSANRYTNSDAMLIWNCTYWLIEECEIYWFHRQGIDLSHSSHCVVQRNYANSRDCAWLPDGVHLVSQPRGDRAFMDYPGNRNLWENNISERTTWNYGGGGSYGDNSHNRVLGHISVNDNFGWSIEIGPNTHGDQDPANPDLYMENFLVQNPIEGIGYITGTSEFHLKHLTGISNKTLRGFKAYSLGTPPPLSCEVTDSVITGLPQIIGLSRPQGPAVPDSADTDLPRVKPERCETGLGFCVNPEAYTASGGHWLLDHCNSWNNGANFYPDPPADGRITNAYTQDPQWQTSNYTWVSDGDSVNAPGLHGYGTKGGDIGANILYAYEGTDYNKWRLTRQPLWSASDGHWLAAGALVAGVNDIAGDSAINVHERLHISPSTLPADYGKHQASPGK